MGPWHRRFTRGWSRPRFLLVLTMVLVAAIALLAVARASTDRFVDDLSMNLGATLLGVVVTVLVLEPVIKRSRTPEEVIHPQFPHELFIAGVTRSGQTVRILGAWPYVMDEPWRGPFLRALRATLDRGVHVQILVLDPTSFAAEQRAADLDGTLNVPAIIGEVIAEFQRLALALPPETRRLFEVGIYSSLPPARFYRWDRRTISSFFPMGNGLGSDIKHYETNIVSGLGGFVDDQFDLIWADSATRMLDEFLNLPLAILVDGTERRSAEPYVHIDGEIFIIAPDLVEDLYRMRTGQPEVRLLRTLKHLTLGPEPLVLEPLARDDDRTPTLLRTFLRKYGRAGPLDHPNRLIMRLASGAADPGSDLDRQSA